MLTRRVKLRSPSDAPDSTLSSFIRLLSQVLGPRSKRNNDERPKKTMTKQVHPFHQMWLNLDDDDPEIGGRKNVCGPPTSFCNKLQKTSICYGLLNTKGGIPTSSSLYLSLLLGLRREERERDDKSKKATPHIWEEVRRSARSRNSTPTHTHPSSRAKGISFFLLLLFSFRAMSYSTRRVVPITWAAPKQNTAASKCHTLKAY